MDRKIPRPGEIYDHFKYKPYQIITIASDSETGEQMVVYQALYGDFKTYVRSLAMFMSEVDHEKYPDMIQKYRFELREKRDEAIIFTAEEKANEPITTESSIPKLTPDIDKEDISVQTNDGGVNLLLMKFLDAESYSKKLDVLSSNRKHLNDRLITDMSVALDLAVDEGPLDQRINELIYCLQAMCRFEDRRLR